MKKVWGTVKTEAKRVGRQIEQVARQADAAIGAAVDKLQVKGDHMQINDAGILRGFLDKYTKRSDKDNDISYLTKQVAGYDDQESFLSFYFGKAMNETKKLADGVLPIEVVSKWPMQAFLIISDHLVSQDDVGKIGWFLNEVNRRKGGEFDQAKSLLSLMQQEAVKGDGESFDLVFPGHEINADGILVKKADSSAKFKLSSDVFEVIPEVIVDPQELLITRMEAARAVLKLAELTGDKRGAADKKAEIALLHVELTKSSGEDESAGAAEAAPAPPEPQSAPAQAPEPLAVKDVSEWFKKIFTSIPPGWTDLESQLAAAEAVDYDACNEQKNMASGSVAPKETHTINLIDSSGNKHHINLSYRLTKGRQCDVEIWAPNGDVEGMMLGSNIIAYGRIGFDDEGRVIVVSPALNKITFNWVGDMAPSTIGFEYGLSETMAAIELAGGTEAVPADFA